MFISLVSFAASVLLILSIITMIAVVQCVYSGRYEKVQLVGALGHLVWPLLLVVAAHTGLSYTVIGLMLTGTIIVVMCAWGGLFSADKADGGLGVLWMSFVTVALIPVTLITGFSGETLPAFVLMVVIYWGAWIRYLIRLIKQDKGVPHATPGL